MKLQISGKLTSATSKQPSFAGFRIEALFDRKQIGAGFEDDAMAARVESDYATATASVPFRVSALSDADGNFALAFPHWQELAGRMVRFVVSSPAGRVIRELEIEATDLAQPVTIDLGRIGSTTVEEPAAILTQEGLVVDSLFRSDTALRDAITQNLRSRHVDAEAVEARVEKAWRFNPSELSNEALAQRHYVAPGADPGPIVETVIRRGVNARRSDRTERTLVLRKSAGLKNLMEEAPDTGDAVEGTIGLGPLMDFISSRSAGASLATEPVYTLCKAELQADTMLAAFERNGEPTDDGAPIVETSTTENRGADALVKDSVNLQMKSATAPESQLAYGKIPNSSDEDKVQRGILQTFQLRPGASDVTSYHDFHTLQIAFEHVWTRIFDGQLTTLGRDLYREYVKLKDFSGSPAPDLQVGTLADLRRLIDEVKKLSQFVDEDIPPSLHPAGGEQKNNGLPIPTPEDAARAVGAVATGGASLFIEWAFNELVKLGNRPVKVGWNSFPLKLNEATDNVIELLSEQNGAYPGTVEIVLETDSNSFKKQIVFQQWDSDTQRPLYHAEVQNFGPGHGSERGPSGTTIIDRLLLNTPQIAFGTLKFVSEDEILNHVLLGRYVLGDLSEVLKDRTKVTFRWKGHR